jgi:hypothetical protein
MSQIADTRVSTVERALFPGGKPVLVAKNAAGQFLIGLSVKTNNPVGWCRAGHTTADRERLQQAVDEEYGNRQTA